MLVEVGFWFWNAISAVCKTLVAPRGSPAQSQKEVSSDRSRSILGQRQVDLDQVEWNLQDLNVSRFSKPHKCAELCDSWWRSVNAEFSDSLDGDLWIRIDAFRRFERFFCISAMQAGIDTDSDEDPTLSQDDRPQLALDLDQNAPPIEKVGDLFFLVVCVWSWCLVIISWPLWFRFGKFWRQWWCEAGQKKRGSNRALEPVLLKLVAPQKVVCHQISRSVCVCAQRNKPSFCKQADLYSFV